MLMSLPRTLTEAIRVVQQLESAYKVCKINLHGGKHKSLYAVASSTADEKITAEIRELKELVLRINKKVEELRKKSPKRPLVHIPKDQLLATSTITKVTMPETALLSQERHNHKPREMVYGPCEGPTRPRTLKKWGPNTS